MISVAVIIPVYNREKCIVRALQSVVAQSWSPTQIIVVDDGSTDGTAAVLDRVKNTFNLTVITLNTNHGVSFARNRGVAASTASFIAFLDSDDLWEPNKLEQQMRWFQKNPHMRIVQTREIWIRSGKRVNPPKTHIKKSGHIFMASLKRCMITPSSVVMDRGLFDEFRGFNESLPACEDYDLWLKITSRYSVGLVDEDLMTRYGGHGDQLSATVPVLDRYRVRSMLDVLHHYKISPEQEEKLRATMVKKAAIIAAGCQKRGYKIGYETYRQIAQKYC